MGTGCVESCANVCVPLVGNACRVVRRSWEPRIATGLQGHFISDMLLIALNGGGGRKSVRFDGRERKGNGTRDEVGLRWKIHVLGSWNNKLSSSIKYNKFFLCLSETL